MDWARDNTGASDRDFEYVFKYEPKPTTVVRMMAEDKEPTVWSLADYDWGEWMRHDLPRLGSSRPGLTLILAKRAGESVFGTVRQMKADDWLDRIATGVPARSATQRTTTFASFAEKGTVPSAGAGAPGSGRRGLRTLPFSESTFRLITQAMYAHGSIARVISRADIPVFSYAEVKMGDIEGTEHDAYVYNCRTSNAWDFDLALTATYFPHYGLTFSVLFGCPLFVEEEILKRLTFATTEAAHPLLIPGIIAEIERKRHIHVVETTIDELEMRILELDFKSGDMDRMPDSGAEKRNHDKRAAWLDTTYLRNNLIIWKTQLAKMREHTDELNHTVFRPGRRRVKLWNRHLEDDDASPIEFTETDTPNVIRRRKALRRHWMSEGEDTDLDDDFVMVEAPMRCTGRSRDVSISTNGKEHLNMQRDDTVEGIIEMEKQDLESIKEDMRKTGYKINGRIQTISDEYDDKIRDCSMRLDGVALATQWTNGETTLDIALATSRDSKHMRSIALVTMVFLPGTFFASVFSMTFFSWSGENGEPTVSGYVWIYVVVAAFFTILTVCSWYYFVVYRQSTNQKPKDEAEMPLVWP